MSVLENLFFAKAILLEMAPYSRVKASLYFIVWLAVVIWRDTPLDLIATAAQVLFSEEIIARWLRLEWALNRFERIYESTYRLFQSFPAANRFPAFAIDCLRGL